MNQEGNIVVKKFLTKMLKEVLRSKKYSSIDDVEIFFVFGSKVKTAMCDWVYGMRIFSKKDFGMRDDLIKELQMEVRKNFERFFGQSICATDIIFERDY